MNESNQNLITELTSEHNYLCMNVRWGSLAKAKCEGDGRVNGGHDERK